MKERTQLFFPMAALILGVLGLIARRLLYAAAYDPASALLAGHPLSGVLAALVLLALAGGAGEGWLARRNAFRPETRSGWALAGCLTLAASLAWTLLTTEPKMTGALGLGWRGLGWLAAACLIVTGGCRMTGKRPPFLLHLPVCLFWLIHMINQYQTWSGTPQLQSYLYEMLGCMGLMLYAYYIAARSAGEECLSQSRGVGIAAVPLCLMALAWTVYPWLYLGGAAWVLLDLPQPGELLPPKEKEKRNP